MWRQREVLQAANTDVLVVSFEPMERVHWYLEEVEFGWPVLSDPGLDLYRAYGLGRASTMRAWLSPRTVAFYLRQALRGKIPRRPQADVQQLGGDFVVDGAGTVRFAHRSVEPADRPSVARLLALVQRLAH